MTTQQSNGGRAALLVALLALAAGGVYFALFRDDGEHAGEDELATDARSAPRSSRSPRGWGSGDDHTETEIDAPSDRGRSSGVARNDTASSGAARAQPHDPTTVLVTDAGARTLPIPASRRPLPPPAARPERTEPVPADVRLRSSQALERIAEQRIAELTEHLAEARRSGNTTRAAHIERMIARIREQQPRIREHVEATRREVEPPSDEPDVVPAESTPASDSPESGEPSAP